MTTPVDTPMWMEEVSKQSMAAEEGRISSLQGWAPEEYPVSQVFSPKHMYMSATQVDSVGYTYSYSCR